MERSNSGSGDGHKEAVGLMLDRAWPLPRDTYITDGFPELLTQLALLPSRDASGAPSTAGHRASRLPNAGAQA